MRVQLFRFAGFKAGETDFAIVGGIPGAPVAELDDALHTIANGITGAESVCGTITVVGHSDRQNRADFSCDQRRQSEIDSATDRANSGWEWCKEVVSFYVAQTPGAPADWWESSDRVTWDLVYAAAGMLRNGSASEAESAQNRRVEVLISIFRV